MKDVIVIGLGPAGITASIYLLRAKLDVLCFEKLSCGGQVLLTDRIENYPGFPGGIAGFDLAKLFEKQLYDFSPQIKNENVLWVKKEDHFILGTDSGQYQSLALIVSSGARPRRLNIKGEIDFTGRGVSYCGTCDAPFFKNKDVAVVGGGNTAIEEAIYLSRFARKIYLIHRKSMLRADKVLQERIASLGNIEFLYNSLIDEICGEKKVEYIKVRNIKDEKIKKITLDGVFIFAGYSPNTEFVKDFLQLDSDGYIIAGVNYESKINGAFVAGDVRKGSLKQIVSSCGEGAEAAIKCREFVDDLKGIKYI